jgi:hypothetical protein
LKGAPWVLGCPQPPAASTPSAKSREVFKTQESWLASMETTSRAHNRFWYIDSRCGKIYWWPPRWMRCGGAGFQNFSRPEESSRSTQTLWKMGSRLSECIQIFLSSLKKVTNAKGKLSCDFLGKVLTPRWCLGQFLPAVPCANLLPSKATKKILFQHISHHDMLSISNKKYRLSRNRFFDWILDGGGDADARVSRRSPTSWIKHDEFAKLQDVSELFKAAQIWQILENIRTPRAGFLDFSSFSPQRGADGKCWSPSGISDPTLSPSSSFPDVIMCMTCTNSYNHIRKRKAYLRGVREKFESVSRSRSREHAGRELQIGPKVPIYLKIRN